MTKTVAIHQPEYFPWLGLLDKARRSDVFVVLDSVQFDRSSLQHRAKVLGPQGVVWLTIPFVHRHPQRIDELEFADPRWATKHSKTLQACYGKRPRARAVLERLEPYFATPHARVVDATLASTELLFEAFGITTPVVRASALDVQGDKAELVLSICTALGATRYLSGRTGAAYLAEAPFGAHGIEIEVQRFEPLPYPRRPFEGDELRGLSALDAWLELGDDARTYFAGVSAGESR
jgi:hypothetical protein